MIDQDHAAILFGSTASAMTMASQVEAEKSQIPIVTSSYADPLVQRGMKIHVQDHRTWQSELEFRVECTGKHDLR
jgi:hypothetical protein